MFSKIPQCIYANINTGTMLRYGTRLPNVFHGLYQSKPLLTGGSTDIAGKCYW